MLVAGLDIGSLSTDAVIMRGPSILAGVIVPTGANSKKAAYRAMEEAMKQIGVGWGDMACIVATGYGRLNVPFAHRQVTEISCHGKGAHFLVPDTHTVIDIGGQDSKVIRLDEQGKVQVFAMNEKCAAGTGRFLEVMARALEVELDEMGDLSRKAERAAAISSMCTVFAESEVVSLVAEGVPREEIIRGLHEAIATRTVTLARRVGVVEAVTMTGGVAKNLGVVEAICRKLGLTIHLPPEPQLVGALGAALVAGEIGATTGG